MTATLPQLARRHCAATKPALKLESLVEDSYGITGRSFRRIAAGKQGPRAAFLLRISQAHIRLFPTEPVVLQIPNCPPILIGHIPGSDQKN